jgi:uncharacterized protein YfaT (DUF1175 family)
MVRALLALALLTSPLQEGEPAIRQAIAAAAVAQLTRIDPAWNPSQRDCAGLVRFAYRTAFRELGLPADALWRDRAGAAASFADAETLLARSFVKLGRGALDRERVQSGDLVAFRQGPADGSEVFHLMLVVRDAGPARGEAWVVYHPGEAGAEVRSASLELLARDSPPEWRPVPENPAFLGFYRFSSFENDEAAR